MTQTLQELWMTISTRIQSAQQRVDGAENDQQSRYFKGQADALRVVLRDIEAAQFELGMEPGENTDLLALSQRLKAKPQKSIAKALAEALALSEEAIAQKAKKPRKRRASRSITEPLQSPYKALADLAVAKGIIVRTSSHFLHALLPKGHSQGFNQLYQAFEEDEHLRQGIQAELEQLAVKETQETEAAAVPAEPQAENELQNQGM